MSMLVTRPEPGASGTAVRLRALGIDVVSFPMLVRQVLETDLPDPGPFSAMVASSGQALRVLAERQAIDRYRHLPLFAVGETTAIEAEVRGFAQVTHSGGGLSDLAALIAASGQAGKLFYPTAEQVAGDLAEMLAPSGIEIVTTPIYRMEPVHELPESIVSAIASGEIEAALFYSRRTAQSFVAALAGRLNAVERRGLSVLSLSQAVADQLLEAGYGDGGVAEVPDEEAMMSLALAFARQRNTP